MKLITAFLLSALFVCTVDAFGATSTDEKTVTITIAPPLAYGDYGRGCPASLPGGGTTEIWSDFNFGENGKFYFQDPLPSSAILKTIDVTITGAAAIPIPGVRVYLNQYDQFCYLGRGTGYPLGTFIPAVSPSTDANGHCGRTFQPYTVSAPYDPAAAFAICSVYWKGGQNSIAFRSDSQWFDFSSVNVTLHYTGVSDYTATGQILDGTAAETKPISEKLTTYAQVPLGLELQLGIKDASGNYIPAQFVLSPATLSAVANPTLYPTNAVLEYGRTVHEGQKTFIGVHIGTQALTVIPDDTKLPHFTFTIGVIDPGALGNKDVQYDPIFVNWGNKRGFPPHILKGLVRQEGPFNPLSYRYEPISRTTGDRFIQSVLTTAPYSSYILGTSTGLAQGAFLTSDDIAPRNGFEITRPDGSTSSITAADTCPTACVSARQIFEGNDDTQNWSDPKFVGATDWWDEPHLRLLEFTAQTPEAASYGLMQTMYVRATELHWVTADGRRNPSLLFDTTDNALIGGGSIAIGTLELYQAYRACNAPDLATDPDFASSDAYETQIIDMLNWYNHGNANRNPTYGDDAWGYSQQYKPSHPLSKIFP